MSLRERAQEAVRRIASVPGIEEDVEFATTKLAPALKTLRKVVDAPNDAAALDVVTVDELRSAFNVVREAVARCEKRFVQTEAAWQLDETPRDFLNEFPAPPMPDVDRDALRAAGSPDPAAEWANMIRSLGARQGNLARDFSRIVRAGDIIEQAERQLPRADGARRRRWARALFPIGTGCLTLLLDAGILVANPQLALLADTLGVGALGSALAGLDRIGKGMEFLLAD